MAQNATAKTDCIVRFARPQLVSERLASNTAKPAPSSNGTTLANRNPACSSRDRYSASVRSMPETLTSYVDMEYAHGVAMVWLDPSFDQQNPSMSRHCRAKISQDRQRLFVVPVMDDLLQDVGVCVCRNGFEEAPADDLTSVPASNRLQRSTGHDIGKVEQHALHGRVRGQNRCEREAMSAAYVDDAAYPVKIVVLEQRIGQPG